MALRVHVADRRAPRVVEVAPGPRRGSRGAAGAVLVTGASKGIGAATARRLARDGFDVAVHCHQDRRGAQATARAVRSAGRQAEVFEADLGDADVAARLAEEVAQAFPHLSGVVHNAGVYLREQLADATADSWRRTLAVDLDTAFHVTAPLASRLRRRRGAVVLVSSIVAVRGSAHGVHYAAAKAGLLGLARSLALELAPEVRVNAVAPGYVDTRLLEGDSAERRRRREEEVPLGRVGTPEDVAGAVSFLMGPDSAYVTGAVLHVNGGLWMG